MKQPAYEEVTFRKVGDFINTDIVLNQVFWLGVTPLLTERQLSYVTGSLSELVSKACELQTAEKNTSWRKYQFCKLEKVSVL